MKIAFWSNVNEKCCVSANLAAISVASVIRFPYRVIVLENHLKYNNLGKVYKRTTNIDVLKEAATNYYEGAGIEGLLRRIYRGELEQEMFQTYVQELIQSHLYYIPQGNVIHQGVFDYEFHQNMKVLFGLLDKFAEFCFIDTASKNILSSNQILEEADLIVVNLCQNKNILDDFFLNYPSFRSKAVFIISKYMKNTTLNCKNIATKYRIPGDRIVSIPTSGAYCNAYLSGDVVSFLAKNYNNQNPKNPNYQFIQSIRRATYMIMKKALEKNTQLRKETSQCGL